VEEWRLNKTPSLLEKSISKKIFQKIFKIKSKKNDPPLLHQIIFKTFFNLNVYIFGLFQLNIDYIIAI
tara:strand:+ start:1593 stop:1796 length:204 start_codon:yes stop_codon:yes gene_type:complete